MSADIRDDAEGLARALAQAKAAETLAKDARIRAEEALAACLGGKENGSTSFKCGPLAVTVKRGWNYKVDDLESFARKFPSLVRVKKELDARAYETYRADGHEDAGEHVTVTPKKVAVEIKL